MGDMTRCKKCGKVYHRSKYSECNHCSKPKVAKPVPKAIPKKKVPLPAMAKLDGKE